MGAPKGNQFWRARTKHGRDKIFQTSDQLWQCCVEYFDWIEDNPLQSAKAFSSDGVSWNHDVPVMRAMTIQGLCIFLDITIETWSQYRKKKDYSDVIKKAEAIIYNQKFTGAAGGLLNPNIIARDLGLADKTETKHETKQLPEIIVKLNNDKK